MLAVMALGYSALFCVLAVITCMDKWKKYYIASKLLCSLGFLGVFATAGRCSGYGWQFWLMLPAFFCCFDGAFGFSGRARVLCAVDVQDAALERPGFLVSSVRSAPGVQADCA